jgi:hypothetical protein
MWHLLAVGDVVIGDVEGAYDCLGSATVLVGLDVFKDALAVLAAVAVD